MKTSTRNRQGSLIEHQQFPDPHRQQPTVAPDRLRGLQPLDGSTRAMLNPSRWRRPMRERERSPVGWALALLLHLVFLGGTWWEMQPRAGQETHVPRRVDALQVRLIPAAMPAPAVLPPPPPPEPLAPPKPKPRPAPESPSPNAMAASMPATSASVAPAPRLYDANGQPMLPATGGAAGAAGYVQNGPKGDAGLMQHKSPVSYQATRFDKHWEQGENAVDSALRKAVEKTTVTHTFHLAPGIRIKCGVSLAALAGGCGAGDPPAAPSAKIGDERLSMAPSKPLVPPAEPPPPPPSEAECIAIYRANKPLPHGCPVDTPNRSVDAELKERAESSP